MEFSFREAVEFLKSFPHPIAPDDMLLRERHAARNE